MPIADAVACITTTLVQQAVVRSSKASVMLARMNFLVNFELVSGMPMSLNPQPFVLAAADAAAIPSVGDHVFLNMPVKVVARRYLWGSTSQTTVTLYLGPPDPVVGGA